MNTDLCPFGSRLQHYWERLSPKERLMSLDEEALYSLALLEVAKEIAKATPGNSVADAFCGAGGLSIAMALQGKHVVSIDSSAERLEMARENASLFNVDASIEFITGDCVEILPTIDTDTVLLDPPWGGTDYSQAQEFPLSNFRPNGCILLDLTLSIFANVVMRLPKNFAFSELARFDRLYKLQENRFQGQLLHYCIYFSNGGELA